MVILLLAACAGLLYACTGYMFARTIVRIDLDKNQFVVMPWSGAFTLCSASVLGSYFLSGGNAIAISVSAIAAALLLVPLSRLSAKMCAAVDAAFPPPTEILEREKRTLVMGTTTFGAAGAGTLMVLVLQTPLGISVPAAVALTLLGSVCLPVFITAALWQTIMLLAWLIVMPRSVIERFGECVRRMWLVFWHWFGGKLNAIADGISRRLFGE